MAKSELKSERKVIYWITDHCVMGKDSSSLAYEGRSRRFISNNDAEALSQFDAWKRQLETALGVTADHQYIQAPELIKEETVVTTITTKLA